MPQSAKPSAPETLVPNPVLDPQLLPLSYAMPIGTSRFASPAATAFMPQSLVDFIFGRR